MQRKFIQTTFEVKNTRFRTLREAMNTPSHLRSKQDWTQIKRFESKVGKTYAENLLEKGLKRGKGLAGLQPAKPGNFAQAMKTSVITAPLNLTDEEIDRMMNLDNDILNEMFEIGGESLMQSVYIYEQLFDSYNNKILIDNSENIRRFLSFYDEYSVLRKKYV